MAGKNVRLAKKWEKRYLGISWSKQARKRFTQLTEYWGYSKNDVLAYCEKIYFHKMVFNYDTMDYDYKRDPQLAIIATRIAKKLHRKNSKKDLTNQK